MSSSAQQHLESRILVLAPSHKDASLSAAILSKAGMVCTICPDLKTICLELVAGAAVAVMTEESLGPNQVIAPLLEVLRNQPTWSDQPLLVLTRGGTDSPAATRLLETLGNVMLLERPVRISTLVSAVRTAFRSRGRQYQIRDHLQARLIGEQALMRSEERFRQLADAMPQIIWTAQPDGCLDYYNKRWFEYTGLSEEASYSPEGWKAILHPDDVQRTVDHFFGCIKTGHEFNIEYRFLEHATGSYQWFLGRAVPLKDADGKITKWFGSCTNIDEQKRTKEEAINASQAKDQFLAVLSHELRTPLTPVLATLTLLQGNQRIPKSVQEDLRVIRRNVELEARLIDDMLDLTRVARGKLPLNLETVDTHAALTNVFDICCSEIHAKHQQVEFHLDAKHYYVNADLARLQQIFWNLLKNAAKFTPERGHILIRTTDIPTGKLRISVTDSGIGIEPEQLVRLFKAFEQGDRGITRKFGGLGLGLAITKALAEILGGDVRAESEGRGKGATFIIELPTVAPPVSNGDEKMVRKQRALNTPLRLLLLEDHEDTSRIMTRLLNGIGHEVECAGTVAEALKIATAHEFNLIISDIGLPDGTGIEFLRNLRAVKNTPAIALTGFGMEDDVRRTEEAGFNAHLTKPVNFQKLEILIEKFASTAPLAPSLNK